MSTTGDGTVAIDQKLQSLIRVARYRPILSVSIIGLGITTALLEGIGVGFILPIIEVARASQGSAGTPSELLDVFNYTYSFLGIPFTLGYIILGVVLILCIRFFSSFLAAWLRELLVNDYVRTLRNDAYNQALDAEVSYFDSKGSDDIINAIVTQAAMAGLVIRRLVHSIELTFVVIIYASIAFYLAPLLTILAGVLLGGLTYLVRFRIEPGYTVGDRLADANEELQRSVQAGMQGIRDAKLFGLKNEFSGLFYVATNKHFLAKVALERNKAFIQDFYRLSTAVTVFVLIFLTLRFTSMSIGEMGVFLLAMFRLGPKMSNLNNRLYLLDGDLPHLVRTQQFVDQISARTEHRGGRAAMPRKIDKVTFQDVAFSYSGNKRALRGISFEVRMGEFIGIVGPSGAGKSTIISLLTRMYEPDRGVISVDGTNIFEFDLEDWRSRVSVVRQSPYIFNDTLRYNLTIGNRTASESDIERVCEVAQIGEFLDDLPNGLDSYLGDQGVKLSGGQKQRVALGRALLNGGDMLILDEATSDLDTNLERKVQGAIESLNDDYMVITIAHRLSTVYNAERIYTLSDGEIVEQGSHDELLTYDGIYSELHRAQSSSSRD